MKKNSSSDRIADQVDFEHLEEQISKGLYDVDGDEYPGFPRICWAALTNNIPLINFLAAHDVNIDVIAQCPFDQFSKAAKTTTSDKKPAVKIAYDKYVLGKNPMELCTAFLELSKINDQKLTDEELLEVTTLQQNTQTVLNDITSTRYVQQP